MLLIIFRSVLAPLVTLLPAALVLGISGAFIGALGSAGVLQVSFFTQILLIVLILGAGTDYGLFLVFRVREQLLAGSDPKDAVAYSVRRVGESITASAATVIVALLTLLAATFNLYHDLGLPLALGIAVMLLAGLHSSSRTPCHPRARRFLAVEDDAAQSRGGRLGTHRLPARPPPGPDHHGRRGGARRVRAVRSELQAVRLRRRPCGAGRK